MGLLQLKMQIDKQRKIRKVEKTKGSDGRINPLASRSVLEQELYDYTDKITQTETERKSPDERDHSLILAKPLNVDNHSK